MRESELDPVRGVIAGVLVGVALMTVIFVEIALGVPMLRLACRGLVAAAEVLGVRY